MTPVERELSRALNGEWTSAGALELDEEHRFIILSDQHKGGNDGADEFRKCKKAYRGALSHYREAGFTLVLLGDVEELWEQGFGTVERAHADMLNLEASFPSNRYLRIWGNHDDAWMSERARRRKLLRYMPADNTFEALRLTVSKAGQPLGTLLMLHGHQGIPSADQMRGLSRIAVRGYRYLQRWFGIGKETPATDACLRSKQDVNMYNWASGEDRLVLIAGHTHRPVWSSRTHLQKLEAELEDMKARGAEAGIEASIAAKRLEIDERAKKYPPCGDTIKTIPCYFNSGCCKYDDGDITGIEIENGQIRLVKWWSEPEPAGRMVLEETALAGVFGRL